MARNTFEKLKPLALQAVKFGAVGVLNTLIDLGVFALLRLIPFFDSYYPLAKAIAFACGVANSFGMNSFFTFRERPTRRKALRFIAVNLVTFSLAACVLALCVELLYMDKNIANLCAAAASMAAGFMLNKLFVFKGQ